MIKNQASAASLAKVFLHWHSSPELEDLEIPSELEEVAAKFELLIVSLLQKTPRLNIKILEASVRIAYPKLNYSTGVQLVRSLVDVVKTARDYSKRFTSGQRRSRAVRKIVQTISKATSSFKTAASCFQIGKHKVAAKWAHSPNSKQKTSGSKSSDRSSIASLMDTPYVSSLQGTRSRSSVQSDTEESCEQPASTGKLLRVSEPTSTCNRLLSLYGIKEDCVSVDISSQEAAESDPHEQRFSNGVKEGAAVRQGEDNTEFKTECPNALLLVPIAMKRPATKQSKASVKKVSRSASPSASTTLEHNDQQWPSAKPEMRTPDTNPRSESPSSSASPAEKPKKKTTKAYPKTPLKRPAAVSSLSQTVQKPDNAAELRPYGCKSCRNRVGCTPSCWRKNTKPSTSTPWVSYRYLTHLSFDSISFRDEKKRDYSVWHSQRLIMSILRYTQMY